MTQQYCLTGLLFSLNVMPMIMRFIVEIVITKKKSVKRALSANIDDIYINVDIAPGSTCHAFETECLWGGIKVMNMNIWGQRTVHRWRRKSAFIFIINTITR